MKNIFFVLMISILLSYSKQSLNCSISDVETVKIKAPSEKSLSLNQDTIKRKRIMIGKINFGHQTSAISTFKIEAALNLTALMSGKYTHIPLSIRDSISELIVESENSPSIAKVAEQLEADRIFFITVNRIHNMIRIEINSVNLANIDEESLGVGYALLHFMKEDINKPLYDPTILEAMQRAFAVAENDSSMFARTDDKFQVFPAETMVIGGLEFKDNPQILPKWELFNSQVVNSYDAVETIFEATIGSKKYVVYDAATRDSIYALYNMYIVENYRPPSVHEIEALADFDVDNYISGSFTRIKGGAEIEIKLYKIVSRRLKLIRSEKIILLKDDILEYRKQIMHTTKKLLEQ